MNHLRLYINGLWAFSGPAVSVRCFGDSITVDNGTNHDWFYRGGFAVLVEWYEP